MMPMFLTRLRTAPLVVALCCFALAWIGDVWYSAARQIDAARRHALGNAVRDSGIFARVIEEHTVRTIQSADQAVQFLRHAYAEKGEGLDLKGLLDGGVILSDIFNLYSIIGPGGDVLLSSQPFKPVNLADREHVRVHQAQPDVGLFVSKPVLGRVSKKWSIQLTRRIDRPDGGFGGVVVVSMDPFYFTRLYEEAQISPHSVVALIGTDGVVRARRTIDSSEIGQDISKSELFRQIGRRKSGVVQAHSLTDGRERMYAFQRLDAYSLIAVVGIDVEDVHAALGGMRVQLLQQAALSTVAIALFTAVLLFLTRRLLRSRAQAISANAAKTQFLSNMSHELRTPINGILGYAELLREEAEGEEHREFAQIIHASGLHLLSLVNQLLQLNKFESGNASASFENEDIRALVAQVVNGHRASANLKGLRLDASIAPHVPVRLACDRLKLHQVLNNLLHNAIKFTDAGSVMLSLALDGDMLRFSVADTGRGIPVALHEKVFEKFFQVDSGDARLNDGTGLGLPLVRELVNVMGGRAWIDAAARIGTTFCFTLPLRCGAAPPMAANAGIEECA